MKGDCRDWKIGKPCTEICKFNHRSTILMEYGCMIPSPPDCDICKQGNHFITDCPVYKRKKQVKKENFFLIY